jgi:hypothetical protein
VLKKLKTIVLLPLDEKLMLLEALVLLALARLAVLVLPFRWVARVLGKQEKETPRQDDPANAALVLHIKKMMQRTSRNVPWTSKCLDQAVAAKIMLARRGIAATVYFGVKNDAKENLKAHAWLRCGTLYVTGGRMRRRYTVINTFA